MEEHRVLFRRCAEIGVQADFEEKLGPAGSGEGGELGTLIARIDPMQGDPAQAAELVEFCDRALGLVERPAQDPLWAALQDARANALQSLGDLGGDPGVLAEAVRGFDAALEVFTREANAAHWATTQQNRANALQSLCDLSGDPGVLAEAVQGYDAALEVRTREAMPADWATTQSNRASALRSLGELAGDPGVLAEAAQSFDAALKIFTRETMPAKWATTQSNRANALRILGELSGDPDVLAEAVEDYDAALEVRTQGAMPAEWVATQQNRANALLSRARALRRDDDPGAAALAADAASEGYDLALSATYREDAPATWATVRHNRANMEDFRFDLSGDREARARALEGWRAALEVRTTDAAPDLHLQTARSLAWRLFDKGAFAEVVSVLDVALGAARAILADPKKVRDTREQAAERVSGLAGLRAWAGLETGEPAAAALEALELGRARLLALALAGTGEDAPAPRTAAQLRAAIPPGGAAVVPFVTTAGAKAFVLRGGGQAVDEADLLDLAGLDHAVLGEVMYGPAEDPALGGYLGAYNRLQEGIAEEDPRAFPAFAAAAQAALTRLGDLLLAPVDARLRALGLAPGAPVVLLPPGLFSVPPLAAAPVPAAPDLDRPAESFGDRWTVSLAPCFEALIAARARIADWAAEGARARLLAALDPAVIRPGPDGEPRLERPLALAAAEDTLLRQVRPGDPPEVLRGAAAVLAALLRADLFHYSGHAAYISGRPRDSHLVTAGSNRRDVLSVARLVEAHERGALWLRLAVLSGYEATLAGLNRTQDEFVGLPAAFLEAGAAAVRASHWPVREDAAFLFARRFHEVLDLAPGPDGEPVFGPAAAAREAARWLRDGCAS